MHDAAYKALFSHPRMVEDLMRGFVAGHWSDTLDFDTLERLPTEFTSGDLRQRRGDGMWRVRFRGEWLYLLLLLEFQSTVDPYMAVRILVYTGLLYQDLIRRGALEPNRKLPPVLPIVLYNGRSRWTAEVDMTRLVETVGEDLARYQPSQRHFVLDEGRRGDDDLPRRNLVSAVVRLENSRTPADMKRVVDALVDWLSAPKYRELRRSFREWIRQVLVPKRFATVTLAPKPELEEVQTMLAERVQEWYEEAHRKGLEAGYKEGMERGIEKGIEKGIERGIERGLEQGRKKGHAEGRAEGRAEERALLCRLVARKFDLATAERLAILIECLVAPEALGKIGEWVIECETATDLLERTGRVIRST